MSGDGYLSAYHCPNVDIDDMCLEGDANPVHCTLEEEDSEE